MDVAIIADEITAVGWRLVGAQVQTSDAGTVSDCLRVALSDADLVLITAELASAMPDSQLQEALLSERPLVLVMADLKHEREPPDIQDEVRRALGVML
jgi:vacuolar-type H+-ATPase subunit F/Vma7